MDCVQKSVCEPSNWVKRSKIMFHNRNFGPSSKSTLVQRNFGRPNSQFGPKSLYVFHIGCNSRSHVMWRHLHLYPRPSWTVEPSDVCHSPWRLSEWASPREPVKNQTCKKRVPRVMQNPNCFCFSAKFVWVSPKLWAVHVQKTNNMENIM